MFSNNFNSIIELMDKFNTEQKCIDHLEYLRWGGKVVSPFESGSKVYKCSNNRYKCNNTGKYFNVKTNTLFHGSHISIRKWFYAIYIVTSHNKGISSMQLSKDFNITQKTAWFMLQRIRNCFGFDNESEMSGEIEVDETYVGGKNKNRHKDKKVKNSQGRSYKDKTPVFGMTNRETGKILAKVVPDVKGNTLKTIIYDKVDFGSTIHSDEWFAYNGLNREYEHKVIYHGKGIYGIDDSNTNSIEGAWSILKRMIIGIYYHTSKRHLQRYVDEFVFRYNQRKATPYDKFNLMLNNIHYRLTYKQLCHE